MLADDFQSEFMVNTAAIQTWYTRASWAFKLQVLRELLWEINNIDSLMMILNTVYAVSGKTSVYTNSQFYEKSIYDKPPMDHDRSMDYETLLAEKAKAITWFKILNDQDQINVFTGLLRLSGGYVVHQMFNEAKKVYQNKLEIPNLSFSKSTISAPSDIFLQQFSIHLKDKLDIAEYDPQDPFSKEVTRLQSLWDENLKKYQAEVLSFKKKLFNIKPPEKKGKDKKKGKGSKTKVKGKKPKKEKSSKKSKSSKSSKKDKNADDSLDQLQMLPVWIMKYILNMLDKKTLEVAKKVNDYWKSVVQSLLEERKARNKIDKLIITWQKEIDKLEESYGKDLPQEKVTKHSMISPIDCNLIKLFRRGTIKPKLRPKFAIGATSKYSIYNRAIMLQPSMYPTALQTTTVFPRVNNKGEDMEVVKEVTNTFFDEPYYTPNLTTAEKLKIIATYGKDKIIQQQCCDPAV